MIGLCFDCKNSCAATAEGLFVTQGNGRSQTQECATLTATVIQRTPGYRAQHWALTFFDFFCFEELFPMTLGSVPARPPPHIEQPCCDVHRYSSYPTLRLGMRMLASSKWHYNKLMLIMSRYTSQLTQVHKVAMTDRASAIQMADALATVSSMEPPSSSADFGH